MYGEKRKLLLRENLNENQKNIYINVENNKYVTKYIKPSDYSAILCHLKVLFSSSFQASNHLGINVSV